MLIGRELQISVSDQDLTGTVTKDGHLQGTRPAGNPYDLGITLSLYETLNQFKGIQGNTIKMV